MKSWVGLKVFSPSSSWSNAWHQVWENKEGLTHGPQVRAWAQHFLMIQDNSGPRFSSKWNRSEMLNKSKLKVSKSLCPWLSLPYSAADPGIPFTIHGSRAWLPTASPAPASPACCSSLCTWCSHFLEHLSGHCCRQTLACPSRFCSLPFSWLIQTPSGRECTVL